MLGSPTKDSLWKYFPSELGECEDLENYEPGGFHPVHLGDVFDDRYRIVHKLGFGGFSTVWLARDTIENRWAALKIIAARDSATYIDRSVIAIHPAVTMSELFATTRRQFWHTGPNGRHLCLVLPVLGPDLSRLSKGIYSRLNKDMVQRVSLQAARALVQLHSHDLCHGDFTASNITLRLVQDFTSFDEDDVRRLFGNPRTDPLRTYSEMPAAPFGPNYIVAPLDFCSTTAGVEVLGSDICVIDFDQSFAVASPPPELPGIPAKYMAPEVAVGKPQSPASDIWALGCAIFRLRSGEDIFFDYDTNTPEDALRQIVKTLGDLPEDWRATRFNTDGRAVTDDEEGDPFWTFEESERRPLEDRLRAIFDEPPSLFIDQRGNAVDPAAFKPDPTDFPDEVAFRVPYPPSLKTLVWKPTAISVAGHYIAWYSEETNELLKAFPRISERELTLLVDLLSRMFEYDPVNRIKAEEVVAHPWFTVHGTQ